MFLSNAVLSRTVSLDSSIRHYSGFSSCSWVYMVSFFDILRIKDSFCFSTMFFDKGYLSWYLIRMQRNYIGFNKTNLPLREDKWRNTTEWIKKWYAKNKKIGRVSKEGSRTTRLKCKLTFPVPAGRHSAIFEKSVTFLNVNDYYFENNF